MAATALKVPSAILRPASTDARTAPSSVSLHSQSTRPQCLAPRCLAPRDSERQSRWPDSRDAAEGLGSAYTWMRRAAASLAVGAMSAAVVLSAAPAPGIADVMAGREDQTELIGDVAENEADEPGGIMTLILPRPTVRGVEAAQRTMVETWGIVRELFVDPTFNNQVWEDQLETAIGGSLSASSADEAYGFIHNMLKSLDDPFTRLVTPKEYEAFRVSSDGSLEGVGLLLATDQSSGRLVVLSPIEGGPADRAGIQSGDELLAIDHAPLRGLSGPEAADLLRGRAGTAVTITLRPADVHVDTPDSLEGSTEVQLLREPIELSPVFATLLPHQSPDGGDVATGYIRLAQFSQNAAFDMYSAIQRLEGQGATNYILDLRNNPGGLVRSGLEIARMWLDSGATLVNTVDRSGSVEAISLMQSTAVTHRPLTVLVNHGSASASEIVAGALHDNGRATLIGDTTYGKGRIQTVFELTDGSALFVTVAKYLSPALHEIDRIGIAPDMSCAIPIPGSSANALPAASNPLVSRGAKPRIPTMQTPLDTDTDDLREASLMPASTAAGSVGGAPVMVVDEEYISLDLQADSCVLTAERFMDKM
eukprot:TRINITY_DN10365_c0_g1_i1.p1 TRINITY_DN10365_c0_g1~~TRINITY_DN10365_c0_g1_i1.p1  ORF type:complete len:622 (+),score=6.61 TRINITY_DN10365_c0_g1_i1:88-1866(+)